MTVDTPFPQRPPTPFWSPRGPMGGLAGLGDDTTLATTALNDAAAAYISTQQATATCPPGYTLTAAGCQFSGTVTATASVNPTMLILLAVAAYFLMKGGRL
jgi:hypothetical protein